METETVTLQELIAKATKNIGDIVTIAVEHTSEHKALVIYDTEEELTRILTAAYRAVLPDALFIDFNSCSKEEIIAHFNALSPHDLVVLIQSSDFRLNEFRIRIYLFQKKLKVIDHQHLYRNTPDSWETYINALEYDSDWYRGFGHRLNDRLVRGNIFTISSTETELVITGGLEQPKLNIGDYTGMQNIGGTFPIGEIFTEAKNLSDVNGSVLIYAFAGTDFHINIHEPFRIDIVDGVVVSWGENAPESFKNIVEEVALRERPIIREVGFGLNRAISREHILKDITAFERNFGMHFSLGEKHTVYKKQGITADKTRYHVDLFPIVTHIMVDGEPIFNGKEYCF